MSYKLPCAAEQKLVIDEVQPELEEIQFSRIHDLAVYVYGKLLLKEATLIIQSHCTGCLIEHHSQREHICLEPDPTKDLLVHALYIQATDQIDKLFAVKVFQAARSRLQLGSGGSSPVYDFLAIVNHYSKLWTLQSFANVNESLKVEECIKETVELAEKEVLQTQHSPFEEWLIKMVYQDAVDG